MIRFSSEMWTATNESTTTGATVKNLLICAEKLMSMGPVLVRFRANRGGFAALRRFSKNKPNGAFQGVPVHESDDYGNPSKPARIVAVMRDPRTGIETEKLVYGAVA